MFRPPNITKETPIYEVAEHMISTKVYTLPVFDDQGEPVGVIHAKVILQTILTDHGLLSSISKLIDPNDPITSPINSLVGEVYQKLKKEGVSRIVLVDDESKLVGIVSRGDLIKAFIKPTPKTRFASEGTATGYNSFAGEKKFRKDEPVRKYYTALVGSLSESSPRDKVVSTLISSPHNSLVLVDKNNKPSGVLSIHDLLEAIARLRPKEDILLIIKKPSDSVTDKEWESAREYLIRFGRKLKKRMVINKIEAASEESKNANGQTIEFNTTVIVTPAAGKTFVAVTKQRGFLDGIKEAIVLIEKQRRRSGLSKEETRKTQS
ncbi:MAG: inosine 5'-monophosphate dehydrogenase [Candidatus Scalindua brodae]|uniref:Inosine 5'-monophosphate dehydrogenase n=1 Tax=Candidatus Scalindua brodae TaxID=237368 RepID=A0A0B0EN80_9BACT|nr:MAG: inosine 5'-monophosphate dehydrogenase [Candidatus Scalindua brodae]